VFFFEFFIPLHRIFLIPWSFFPQIQLVTLDHRFHSFSEILDSGFAIDFGAPGMDEEPLLLKTFMQSLKSFK